MVGRRSFSASVLLALLGQLTAFSAPAGAQDKKGTKAKGKDGDDPTTALMSLVEEAVKSKDYRHDPKHGDGKNPYDLMSTKPGILVGLDIFAGVRDKTVQYVRGVRPIFLANDGRKYSGNIKGNVGNSNSVKVEAKAGYAVAGLKIHTNAGEIAGMSVVFAKITDTGLDLSDTDESKYYGHEDPNTAHKVVCTGEPILGIHGLVSNDVKSHNFGLGLIVMGKDKKKK
jgi:hypothetical protein